MLDWAVPRLCPTPFVAFCSVMAAFGLCWIGWHLVRWGLLDAVWIVAVDGAGNPDLSPCQAPGGSGGGSGGGFGGGACWAAVGARYRFILFGYYPYPEQWRAALASLVVVGLYLGSAVPAFWRRSLALAWAAGLLTAFCLMRGGLPGLPVVAPDAWGGLPLVLLLSTAAIAVAFPLGVLLALARRTSGPSVLRNASLAYVETCRGIPLVTILFFSSILLPLFLPATWSVPKLVRAQAAIALFTTAYLSEVIRSGLQIIPKGQSEAADALGLGYRAKVLRILLPQAIRVSIPGLVNSSIGLFKNSSIVSIIGMFDLSLTAQTVLADPQFAPYYLEVYAFIGAVYAAFCLAMSRYSRYLEARLGAAQPARRPV